MRDIAERLTTATATATATRWGARGLKHPAPTYHARNNQVICRTIAEEDGVQRFVDIPVVTLRSDGQLTTHPNWTSPIKL